MLQANITYLNGLTINADRSLRYWIKGPKADTSESLADLPVYPDNVKADDKGGFWVALHWEKFDLPFGMESDLLAVRINTDRKLSRR